MAPAVCALGDLSMDMYWTVIYSVAGIGAALVIALVVAAAVLLSPWHVTRAVRQRRSTAAEPARTGAPVAAGTPARPAAARRQRTRAA